MKEYETPPVTGPGKAWMWIAAMAFGLLAWAMFNIYLVKYPPMDWHYGIIEEIPAQSIYSTNEPPPGPAREPQSPPLPFGFGNPPGTAVAPAGTPPAKPENPTMNAPVKPPSKPAAEPAPKKTPAVPATPRKGRPGTTR